MQAAGCSGMSGLNCCWASSLRGFLRYSSHPLQITAWLGTESSMRGIFIGWTGRPGDSRRTVSIVSLCGRSFAQTGAAPGAVIALITAKPLSARSGC